MVCSKCQKKLSSTTLATPGVKHKSEIYHGSPSSILGGGATTSSSNNNNNNYQTSKLKPTLGNTGISKNKLLSAKAKNPYAAYASSCQGCNAKTEQGRKFCQRCAYTRNACAMCGKSLSDDKAKAEKRGQVVVQGQKFNAK